MKLHITTLGVFDMEMGDESLSKEITGAYKTLKLFHYFLTFKNKKILSETIIDNLWQDSESFDPKNMLRAQIYRLRQAFKRLLPEGAEESQYLSVVFKDGYYSLELGQKVSVDVDIFKHLITQGDDISAVDPDSALEFFKEALNIYKGHYLGESSYEIWTVPIRNYYSRLYLKTLYKTIEMLKDKGEHEGIILMCEQALMIEPYEETIHIYLMESMLKLGQVRNALSYYEHISKILQKEMGDISSAGMKEIHRKIKNYSEAKGEINISSMKSKLEDASRPGPLFCNSDTFEVLYNLQKNKRQSEDKSAYMGIITLDCPDCNQDDIKNWSETTVTTLKKILRKGDILTIWNDTQILLILVDVVKEGITPAESRIKENLPSYFRDDVVIKFAQINKDDSYSVTSSI
ncbi:MAG: BTAD domain-containing putative transcriptional regulator [Natronincolaceae bacterium]|jgi:DNA-binding SARP family transcriptional activator